MTIQTYWQHFEEKHKLEDVDYDAWAFGNDIQLADDLANLVKSGIKTATTSALELYEKDESLPKVGNYSVILDGLQKPVCVIQTVVVEVVPFKLVSAEHAYHEGEGDRSLNYWRQVHEDFFRQAYVEQGKSFSNQIPCVCEVFKVVS